MNEIIKPEPAGALTPARVSELMELAIREHGDDAIGKLERLVDLAMKVEDRRARMEFDDALERFQQAMPDTIRKTKRAGASRDGGGFSWWYTPIETLMKVAAPHLKANGLRVQWSEEATGESTTVICRLRHVSGAAEETRVTIRKSSPNPRATPGQIDAGTLTMAMRRALGMALGLVTSDPEDPDAPTGDPITEAQENELDTLLSQLPPARKTGFLKWLGVKSLSEIPASRFGEARAKLVKAVGE